jgi:hypothetical protein
VESHCPTSKGGNAFVRGVSNDIDLIKLKNAHSFVLLFKGFRVLAFLDCNFFNNCPKSQI